MGAGVGGTLSPGAIGLTKVVMLEAKNAINKGTGLVALDPAPYYTLFSGI